jgi:hypothetical protein
MPVLSAGAALATAVTIASALAVFGSPNKTAGDRWVDGLPASTTVLRYVNMYLGTSYGGHWLSNRRAEALEALGVPRTAGTGTDKLPALLPVVLSGRYVTEMMMHGALPRIVTSR